MARLASLSAKKSGQVDRRSPLNKKDGSKTSQSKELISTDHDFELPVSDDEQASNQKVQSKPISKSKSASKNAHNSKATNAPRKQKISEARAPENTELVRDGTRRSQRNATAKRKYYEDRCESEDDELIEADDGQTKSKKGIVNKRFKKMSDEICEKDSLESTKEAPRADKSTHPERQTPADHLTVAINANVGKSGSPSENIAREMYTEKSDKERRTVVEAPETHERRDVRVGKLNTHCSNNFGLSVSNDDEIAENSHPQIELEPHVDKEDADFSFGMKLQEHIQKGSRSDVIKPLVTARETTTISNHLQQLSNSTENSKASDERDTSPFWTAKKVKSAVKQRVKQSDERLELIQNGAVIEGLSAKHKRTERPERRNIGVGGISKSAIPSHDQNGHNALGSGTEYEIRIAKRRKVLEDHNRLPSNTKTKEKLVHFDTYGPANQGTVSPERKKRRSLPTAATSNESPLIARQKWHAETPTCIRGSTGEPRKQSHRKIGSGKKDSHLILAANPSDYDFENCMPSIDAKCSVDYPVTVPGSNVAYTAGIEEDEDQSLRNVVTITPPGKEITPPRMSEEAICSNDDCSDISTEAYDKQVDQKKADDLKHTASTDENSDRDSNYVVSMEELDDVPSTGCRKEVNTDTSHSLVSTNQHRSSLKLASDGTSSHKRLPLPPNNPKALVQPSSDPPFDLVEITKKQFPNVKTQIDVKCFKATKSFEFTRLATGLGQYLSSDLAPQRTRSPRDMNERISKEKNSPILKNDPKIGELPTYVKRQNDCENWAKDPTLVPSSTPLSFGLRMDQKLRDWQARETRLVGSNKENEGSRLSVDQEAETTLIENFAVRYAPLSDPLHRPSKEDASGSAESSKIPTCIQQALPHSGEQNSRTASMAPQYRHLQDIMTKICENIIVRLGSEEKSIEEKTASYIHGVANVRDSFKGACKARLTHRTSKIKGLLEDHRDMLKRMLDNYQGGRQSGAAPARTDTLIVKIAEQKKALLARLATLRHVD